MVDGLLSSTAMSSTRPPMLAGPIDRQTNDLRIGSSLRLIGGGSGGAVGVCGGCPSCASSCAPAAAVSAIPAHTSRRTRSCPRFTNAPSDCLRQKTGWMAEFYCYRAPKFTFGACCASFGASKYGYSLKPNIFAVRFEGNFRREVLYAWILSLYRPRATAMRFSVPASSSWRRWKFASDFNVG